MSQITRILERLNSGDEAAMHELVPLVYQELRRRANQCLSSNRVPVHTLQPTALVHEAYLKLVRGRGIAWQGSRHFYNAAAEVMKQIVLNHARSNSAKKRGGHLRRVALEGVESIVPESQSIDWEAMDAALTELREMDVRRHQVVMLRYFTGLTAAEVAQTLGVSEKTVERDWAAARLFLRASLAEHSR